MDPEDPEVCLRDIDGYRALCGGHLSSLRLKRTPPRRPHDNDWTKHPAWEDPKNDFSMINLQTGKLLLVHSGTGRDASNAGDDLEMCKSFRP